MTTYRVFYTVRTLQLGYVDVQADSEDAAKDQAADVTAKGKDGALTLMPATFDSEFEPNGEVEALNANAQEPS